MAATQGNASKPDHGRAPFVWTKPSLPELDAATPVRGSVLSKALQRAATELRTPARITAGFDNRLAD